MSEAGASKKEWILDSDTLLRRVQFTHPDHVKHDGTASSFAFSLRKRNGVKEKGLSLDLERLTTYERSIKKVSEYRLYALSVKDVRELVLSVCHDPCPPEDLENVAHALITGTDDKPADCEDPTNAGKDSPATINPRLAKLLALASTRLNYPDRS